MLISKYIEVEITNRNSLKYSKMYNLIDVEIGSFIKIKTDILSKCSKSLVIVQCDYCKDIFTIKFVSYNRSINNIFKISCSNKECIKKKTKEVCIIKYGVDNPSKIIEVRNKVKNTIFNKYGVDNPSQSDIIKEKKKETSISNYGLEYSLQSEEVRNKGKLTNLERYGVEYPSKSKIIKDKVIQTNLYKYGVEYPMQSNNIKNRHKKTCLEKYGVEYPSHINSRMMDCKSYLKYLDNSISLFKCDKGHNFEISSNNYYGRYSHNTSLCTICYPIGDQKSIKEKELLEFIQNNYSGNIISSHRDQLEIDIYLPELNIGFEFNGLYFHSNKFKEKNYHLNKTNFFKEKGIRIIHIWEDDWTFRKEIIKSQINNLLKINSKKIFARKCFIKEIKDSKIVSKFLNDNHIQGKVNSSLKLGLYFNEELVSLMTFDYNEGRKKMELGGWNLNRFCNKLNTNVVGGASKLLSYFIKNYDVKRIISYADKDWSVGNLYYTLGFTNVDVNGTDYKYIVDNQRVHKSRYKKSKLNTEFTESKQMEKDGFLKIYDCGKLKFEIIRGIKI